MRPLTISAILLLAFGLILLPLGTGCKDNTPNNSPAKDDAGDGAKKGTEDGKSPPKTPIKSGDGVIKGKVVFSGTVPEQKILKLLEDYKVKGMQVCLAPGGAENFENCDQTWQIGKDKGVANVVVYLKPPKGQFFEPPEAKKKSTNVVKMDQPHCAFRPHVAAVFQHYWDGKKMQDTGEIFRVTNDAPFSHNTKVTISGNSQGSTISPKPPDNFHEFNNLPPKYTPYLFQCDIHAFMQALVWSFDHPYFAVTKDDGSFEIPDVPTGVPLSFFAWHESPGTFNTPTTVTLTKGETKEINLNVGPK